MGHEPGGRDLTGTAEITRDGPAGYVAHYALNDTGGAAVPGESHASVYTGFEWRGRAQLGGSDTREVFAASGDGAQITGRWFEPEHAEIGGDWSAIRQDAAPQVLAVLPRSLRAGTAGVVTVVGTGLGANDTLSFGPGVSARVLSRTPNEVRVELTATADAEPGARTIKLGAATGAAAFVVYRQIDRLEVTPGLWNRAARRRQDRPGISAVRSHRGDPVAEWRIPGPWAGRGGLECAAVRCHRAAHRRCKICRAARRHRAIQPRGSWPESAA